MIIEQSSWSETHQWQAGLPGRGSMAAQLVLLFGSQERLADPAVLDPVRAAYPGAIFAGCSTAGEICGTTVSDDGLVVTAIEFAHATLRKSIISVKDFTDSREAGRRITAELVGEDLRHIFVLSEGLNVNGSELVKGLTENLPATVSVTGGLSGDGSRFQKTVLLAGGTVGEQALVAIGFYGKGLKVGFGSLGGWDTFGPERLITRSKANVLYELDRQSALELYKKYPGEHAAGLPATGLLFPLSLRTHESEPGVVRTILAVDEKDQSMTFAGDLPEGSYARLMKANFDRLIDGATDAATTSFEALGSRPPELAILISCVGRKMVLQQRVEEEVEGVREVVGDKAVLTGFYSYGEISPFRPNARCELHNQTMTITTFLEE